MTVELSPDMYSNFEPMLLEDASAATLAGDDYRRFIQDASIVPALRLFLLRHRQRPEWAYLDTKFNPNTGADRGADFYRRLWGWFLGRGCEGMAGHLAVLDGIAELADGERAELGDLFGRLLANSVAAIDAARKRNSGRVPFCMNLDFQAIDAAGHPIELDGSRRGDSDLFCAKGLIAAGRVEDGLTLLAECDASIEANVFVDEPVDEPKDRIAHGARMLIQAVPRLVVGVTDDPTARQAAFDLAARYLGFVIDHHVDPQTFTFSETIDAETRERGTMIDPGHANELVGLGLSAVAAMEAHGSPDPDRRALLDRVRRVLPRVLVRSMELGFNRARGGIAKAVDNRTGDAINADMPWWNLPETMRAAAHAAAVSEGDLRGQCLEIYRDCHNAYFSNYLNRANMLFPFQTRCGRTGQVKDVAPAVPEGDPLYHTNLSLLEALEVLGTLCN